MRFVRLTVVLACACILGATLVACASAPSESDPNSAGQGVAPGPEAMQAAEKREQLPLGFPIEVPVPMGTITKADRQGADVWVYEVNVASPPEQTLAWYERAYAAANWTEVERSASGGGTRALFQKGGAETEVQVAPGPSGTLAKVSIGIGVPVGDTL